MAVVSSALYVRWRLVLVLVLRVLAFVLVACGGFILPTFASFMGNETTVNPFLGGQLKFIAPPNGAFFKTPKWVYLPVI